MESLCQLGEIKMETLAGTTAKVCLPDFSGPSVCDVVPTIISTLNSRHPLSRLALERPGVAKLAGLMQPGERRKGVIFFILDSVSAVHLQHILSRENVFASCGKVRAGVISSIFPTITQACLPSIWAGGPPGQHGIYGRFFYLPEIGRTTGPIFDRPDKISLEKVAGSAPHAAAASRHSLRIPSYAPTCGEAGIQPKVFVSTAREPFTSMIYGDLPVVTGNSAASSDAEAVERIRNKDTSRIKADMELLAKLEQIATQCSTGGPDVQHLLVAHLLSIGSVGNAMRVNSDEFVTTVLPLWRQLGDLASRLVASGDWQIVFTSDHGMMDMSENASGGVSASHLETLNELSSSMPACNQRSCYLYPRSDVDFARVKDVLQETLPNEHFALVQLDSEMSELLFGRSLSDVQRLRPGPTMVLNVSNGNLTLPWEPRYKSAKLSDHGGLAREELEIPFMVCGG